MQGCFDEQLQTRMIVIALSYLDCKRWSIDYHLKVYVL